MKHLMMLHHPSTSSGSSSPKRPSAPLSRSTSATLGPYRDPGGSRGAGADGSLLGSGDEPDEVCHLYF